MTHLPEALAWTLLHFIWQATVIAALYRLVDWRLRACRTDVRYVAALATLLCMLGSSVATLIYEHLRFSYNGFPGVSNTVAVVGAAAEHVSRLPWPDGLVANDTGQILRWVDCTWLLGVTLFTLRALGGAWRLKKFHSTLSFEAAGNIAARFSAMAERMSVKSGIMLRIHPAARTPFVAGLFRSVVYLPVSALTSLSPDQLDTILIHELAHVRRADYAWNLLQNIMEGLFFYHPAVWWLGRILRERRELCCDDIVVALCSDPLTYAKALLALAEHQQVTPRYAMALDGHRGRNGLLARIARIIGETPTTKSAFGTSTAFRLLISGIAGTAVLSASFVMPLHARLPIAQARHATKVNANIQSSNDILEIQPNKSRLRLRPTEAAEMKDRTVTTADLVAPVGLPTAHTVSSNILQATATYSDSHEPAGPYSLLPSAVKDQTHEHLQRHEQRDQRQSDRVDRHEHLHLHLHLHLHDSNSLAT
jgi:beta-lactamase regulating signal transducer with metallopeptidase domain